MFANTGASGALGEIISLKKISPPSPRAPVFIKSDLGVSAKLADLDLH